MKWVATRSSIEGGGVLPAPNGQMHRGQANLRRGHRAKYGAVVAVAASAALVMTSCSDASQGDGTATGGDATQTGEAVETISIVVRGTANDNALWEEAISKFEAEQPGISVEPVFITIPGGASGDWSSFFSAVQTRIAGGESYDLISIPTEGQMLFGAKGVLEPLDPYIAEDQAEIDDYKADVPDYVWDVFDSHGPTDGNSYFLPFGYNTMAMYYNKAMFDEAGVAYPSADWTWSDMEEDAVKIKEATGGYGVFVPTDLFGYMPWLLTNGAATLEDDWSSSAVASPEGVEAAAFTRSLVERGLAPEPGGTFDRYLAFMQDDLAMLPAGRWPVQSFWAADYDTSNVGIVPFPSNNGTAGSPVGFSALGIYKSSEHKDAAWEFVKYTLSEEFAKWHATSAFDASAPVRSSLADSEEINANSPEGTSYLYEALNGATLIPGIEQQAPLESAYTDTISQILVGTLTPEAGLTQLQETINGIL